MDSGNGFSVTQDDSVIDPYENGNGADLNRPEYLGVVYLFALR
jgi:hypothetical protein